ncbi:hypothetical protein [Kineosporia babensis]|uniref:Uncharacterized protein n=1 Tax=Kineosporia babensis TaxID=499548 RepID=A0A9X1ST91_9ACTN|nr:hypothetical protein [Kineosporia babensis]MCD5310390.1 hypothetical protein [Kineosporia babensis]
MSGTGPTPAPDSDPEQSTSTEERWAVNEDWLATAVGLILLALILAGVITNGLVP